jgi:hypothetical protein
MEQQNQLPPAVSGSILLISSVIGILMIISLWKIFKKAGEPGWAAIIPIYQTIVFLKIAGKPGWWFFLLLIPFVGLVFAILALVNFAERFGKGGGYIVGLIILPFVFFPMLAFGDAQYLGSNTNGALGEPALS